MERQHDNNCSKKTVKQKYIYSPYHARGLLAFYLLHTPAHFSKAKAKRHDFTPERLLYHQVLYLTRSLTG